jgi:hypothetical protein
MRTIIFVRHDEQSVGGYAGNTFLAHSPPHFKPSMAFAFSAQKTPFQARGGDLSSLAIQIPIPSNKNSKSAIFVSFTNKGHLSRRLSDKNKFVTLFVHLFVNRLVCLLFYYVLY